MKSAENIPWRLLIACLVLGEVMAILALGPEIPAALSRRGVLRGVAFLGVAGLAAGGWLFFGAWSWRWMARRRNTERGSRIFWWGVVLFGGSFGSTQAVRAAVEVVGGAANVLSLPFLRALLVQAVIHSPIALWAGWFWGSMMTFTFGNLPAAPKQANDP